MFKFGQHIEASTVREPTRKVHVTLDKATKLPVADVSFFGGKSDPYVKIILSDQIWQSPVIMKTVNPSWGSVTCEMPLTISEFERSHFLKIEIWDFDSVSKDDLMGTVEIDLTDEAMVNKKEYDIVPSAEFANHKDAKIYLDIVVEPPSTSYKLEVWENERWSRTHRTWSKDHLDENSDRPPWSAGDSLGGKTFKDALPEILPGYKPEGAWVFQPMPGTENGWLYAHSFSGPWHQEKSMTHCVRARQWTNMYHDKPDYEF
ncbi:C2 domain-containing protein [Thraustotheca clavata]|uniref:C2 domain-containing protein n=1 Tax=Thraustotheca clavata TaxID=74557 RepID=A0A1W0A9J7_9STRA|nr:C2 domain-containing protein [Thraustotheca clavata]